MILHCKKYRGGEIKANNNKRAIWKNNFKRKNKNFLKKFRKWAIGHGRVIMRGLWSGWGIQIMAYSAHTHVPSKLCLMRVGTHTGTFTMNRILVGPTKGVWKLGTRKNSKAGEGINKKFAEAIGEPSN